MAPCPRLYYSRDRPLPIGREARRHLRARLDALYHLYGLSREDASYVLDTFPIVRRKQDEAAFGSLPHPRPHPGLHERPRCRRYRYRGGYVDDASQLE